jgi:DNA helicase-2/ATP-dependent DNA helicase PcrA
VTIVAGANNSGKTSLISLFSLLFLFEKINEAYRKGLYGSVIRFIKNNKKILNASEYTIKKHNDKKKVKELLENVMNQYENGERSIGELLEYTKKMKFVSDEYIEEIIGEEDYSAVIKTSMEEFHNLVKYLKEPNISTQHGVKGESHDTVIFLAANSSRNPVVNMTKFFELWSSIEVNLSEFEKFYYEYKRLIENIEKIIEIKCSDMKKDKYTIYQCSIDEELEQFENSHLYNRYFNVLLQASFSEYFSKKSVTKTGYGEVDGLCGANCRHTFYPFIPGIDVRTYTDEQLEELNAKENEKKSIMAKNTTSTKPHSISADLKLL